MLRILKENINNNCFLSELNVGDFIVDGSHLKSTCVILETLN